MIGATWRIWLSEDQAVLLSFAQPPSQADLDTVTDWVGLIGKVLKVNDDNVLLPEPDRLTALAKETPTQ